MAFAFSQSNRSVWDGVYSDRQANRGRNVYETACASCHEPDELRGDVFMSEWKGRTVEEYFDYLWKNMPKGNPESLPRAEYGDVIAYIFRQNTFPAGRNDLDTRPENLRLIRIEPKSPKD